MIVRVVSKGSLPSRQLNILRYLSREPCRSDARNHAIPIVQELAYQDWVFVAMPRLSSAPLSQRLQGQDVYWFSNISCRASMLVSELRRRLRCLRLRLL